jgi:two-component system, cell cycle response regulator
VHGLRPRLTALPEGKRRPVLILLGLTGVGIVAHLALVSSGLGAGETQPLVNDWLYNSVLIAAASACLWRGAAVSAERPAWLAFGTGLGLWAAGDLYWTLEISGRESIPYPSAADALYLAGYVALYAGITLLVRARVRSFATSMWLDGAIGALAAAALGTAVLQRALTGLTEGGTAEAVTNLAYPLGDLLLLSFVIGALAMVGSVAGRRDWILIAAGLFAAGIADAIFLYAEATGSYTEGTPIDSLWLVSAGLIALAAWVGARAPHVRAERGRSLVLPSLFAIVAVALQVYDLTRPLNELSAGLATATLVVVVVRLFVAFAENARLLGRVGREAATDALTGLGNRRQLLADLSEALDGGRPPDGASAFAIFDLDGFKAYNDSYGHGAGDLLLSRLGRNLAAAVRPFGSAYRLGGDEFCVLVSGSEVKLDSILAAATAALSERGKGFSITCSQGSVKIPHETREPSEALRLADRRMYSEKGRRLGSAGRQTTDVLTRVLREREPELGEHLQGVAALAGELGRRLALTSEELDVLHRAAELHDIGKMAIPDEILHKPGSLTEEEWNLLRTHTLVGERILQAAPAMGPVAKVVRWTHERWDGEGYPDGLAGEEIPLGARIIFVCDAFDAMTSERAYRAPVSVDEAVEELRRNAGTQFDPMVVELLCEMLEESRSLARAGRSPSGDGSRDGARRIAGVALHTARLAD